MEGGDWRRTYGTKRLCIAAAKGVRELNCYGQQSEKEIEEGDLPVKRGAGGQAPFNWFLRGGKPLAVGRLQGRTGRLHSKKGKDEGNAVGKCGKCNRHLSNGDSISSLFAKRSAHLRYSFHWGESLSETRQEHDLKTLAKGA